ncbi:MAG: 2-C-methyl-D-erythritol 4-phosphate cytidylyltransferase [Bacteroidota bacterium]|nr:2-C-methyl-D-erythritol 4-phosphate cytidylyltransferase [Bacteroidota bacterium]
MAFKKYALITAGGTGKRMQSTIPKQFLILKDKPILIRTMEIFHDVFPDLKFVIVLGRQYWKDWKTLCEKYDFHIEHQLAAGGGIRFQSVKNGLDAIDDDGLVAVHDGVRPLVSKAVIKNGFDLAEKYGNAVPCTMINESVRTLTGNQSRPVDRNQLRIIQTPQVFKIKLIKDAYQAAYDPLFTDEATVLESSGEKIHLFEGNPENIKITKPGDLLIARALMSGINF